MEKLTIKKENGLFFAKISDSIFEKLNNMEINLYDNYDEQNKEIKRIFNISENEDTNYLVAIKNSVERYYKGLMYGEYYNSIYFSDINSRRILLVSELQYMIDKN